jgi:hypothetical protein
LGFSESDAESSRRLPQKCTNDGKGHGIDVDYSAALQRMVLASRQTLAPCNSGFFWYFDPSDQPCSRCARPSLAQSLRWDSSGCFHRDYAKILQFCVRVTLLSTRSRPGVSGCCTQRSRCLCLVVAHQEVGRCFGVFQRVKGGKQPPVVNRAEHHMQGPGGWVLFIQGLGFM